MKIKQGDSVQIIRGKDKGRVGKVADVFPKVNKILVEGVNQYKRHIKAKTQNQKSEIVTITKPLPVSNLKFICPKCKKMARVGYKKEGNEKVRVCKKCNAVI